ncbi:MAG: hypothetical protein ACYSSP_07510 [Planctomycetota bacterium]
MYAKATTLPQNLYADFWKTSILFPTGPQERVKNTEKPSKQQKDFLILLGLEHKGGFPAEKQKTKTFHHF